jgi:hypothetical protein
VTGRTCANDEPLAVGAKDAPALGILEAFWDGRPDDVRVYRRALSAAAVADLARDVVAHHPPVSPKQTTVLTSSSCGSKAAAWSSSVVVRVMRRRSHWWSAAASASAPCC